MVRGPFSQSRRSFPSSSSEHSVFKYCSWTKQIICIFSQCNIGIPLRSDSSRRLSRNDSTWRETRMHLYDTMSLALCARNEYVTVMALSVARTKTTRFDCCCCSMGERRCGCVISFHPQIYYEMHKLLFIREM